MQDTNQEIIKKQQDIFFSKKPVERFMTGIELLRFGRLMVENSIKQKHYGISELDLKIAVFKRYYENIFSKEELVEIIASMVKYWEKKNKVE